MGRKDGFLLYERENATLADPIARIGNFDEFRRALPWTQRQYQAARSTLRT